MSFIIHARLFFCMPIVRQLSVKIHNVTHFHVYKYVAHDSKVLLLMTKQSRVVAMTSRHLVTCFCIFSEAACHGKD